MNRYYNYPHMDKWGAADYLSGNDCFDLNAMKHSEAGKYLMEARSLMTRFSDVDDPALLKLWENMGIRCEIRSTNGKTWLAFVPMEAYEETNQKYPVMLIFRPVGLLAEAFYANMIEMAAQGEFLALIYCDEDPDANDVFFDMLQEALRDFPTDPSRVYTTGHSHYGELAMEFTRRFKEHVAGIAQQGDAAGIIQGFYGMTKEKAELMHSYDMPLINVAGTTEFNGIFPLNQEAPGIPEDSHVWRSKFPTSVEDRLKTWKERLYCMRCPIPSDEALRRIGKTKAEQELGFPADHTDILYAEGSECYIGDIKNLDGNWHFRTVAMQNIPHTTCRTMHVLSWSFLRRFARDLENGKVIELY